MATAVIFLGVYVALAALFYTRLTATASDGLRLPAMKPSHWHRAKRRVTELMRRVRTGTRKR